VGGTPASAPPTYGAPSGSGGQLMLVSGGSAGPTLSFSGEAQQAPQPIGTISISKSVPDGAYYGPGGAVFQVENGAGQVLDTLTTNAQGSTPYSSALPASSAGIPYDIHEVTAPAGYRLAANQTVRVFPNQHSVATYAGATEEPVQSAQLGARKVDAQTGQVVAGAVFAFRFASADNGVYDVDLGQCTTGANGVCQPPTRNAPGGWLPGWYQVTEVHAPPGYWRDPSSTVQHVFVPPGASATASVTFADQLLGSVQLQKSGNDTAYWAVSGARFAVTGPDPATTPVGALVVGPNGTSTVLTGLTPGSYTFTETTAPPGYATIAPFTAVVGAGHATTTVSAADPIQPGTLVVEKTDATTGTPLGGATFDTRFDSHDDGDFDVDLGTCRTDAAGSCAPPPNDGTGFLPGRYRVTEVAPPTGYAMSTPLPSQVVVVAPSATASFSFTDRLLVGASFTKVATGNYDPTQVVLSGAVIDVTAGTAYGGPVVATCTTDDAGRCTTGVALLSGEPYCWLETTAPPGLASGATGCFTASNSLATLPITVSDRGTFVAVAAKKVDAAAPSVTLPGAVLDLYRGDGGHGPPSPTPPGDALAETGQTWVARGTTGATGVVTFPLQFPGYAYCVVEHAAPQNYVTDRAERCTSVLEGVTTSPPATVTVTVPDAEAPVALSARKYNSATPGTGIPRAVYDLYVEGRGPPSGPPSPPPAGAVDEAGSTWWGRGTTSTGGGLHFTVPAGYSWCLREVSAPTNYVLDQALHCTAAVDAAAPTPSVVVALPETTALVEVYAHKFNAARPGTTIPGATYELVGHGGPPPGWSAPPNPLQLPVPAGDWFVGSATTGHDGYASWSVPAGRSWCLHEVSAPAGYRVDTGWHCTSVVTTATQPPGATVALPEVPVPGPVTAVATSTPGLAFTGGPGLDEVLGGLGLGIVGGGLMLATRRRRPRHAAGRSDGGAR
ncbi:MAG: MSCRAMM family protein, partial [Acidimicrobiales bacterium]